MAATGSPPWWHKVVSQVYIVHVPSSEGPSTVASNFHLFTISIFNMLTDDDLSTRYSDSGYAADVESGYSGETSPEHFENNVEDTIKLPARDRIYSPEVEEFFHGAVDAAEEVDHLRKRLHKFEIAIRDLRWDLEGQDRNNAIMKINADLAHEARDILLTERQDVLRENAELRGMIRTLRSRLFVYRPSGWY